MPPSVDPAFPDPRARRADIAVIRILRRVSLLVPAVMVAISGCILGLRHLMGAASLSTMIDGSYFTNNVNTLRAIPHLAIDDSWGPMLAVRDWLRTRPGGDAYNHFFFGLETKFQYPLSSLIAIEWVPFHGDRAVHVLNALTIASWLATVVGMVLLTLRLARMFAIPAASDSRSGRLWMMAVAAISTVCFYPVMRGVYLGQIQVLLDAMFIFACYAFAGGRPGLAGILLGLSALVKPQMALFLLWGLLRKDRAFVTGLAACAVLGYVASGALYGWGWPRDYLRVLTFIGQHGESFYPNQSVNGLVNRMLGNGTNLVWEYHRFAPYNPITYALTITSTVALVAAGLWSARTAITPRAATASLMVSGLCFTLASPVAWDHHYGVLLPLFSLLFICLLETLRHPVTHRARWLVLCATFAMTANVLSPLNLLASSWFNIAQSYVFLSALGVLVLVFVCRRDLGLSALSTTQKRHTRHPLPVSDAAWRDLA
jgi:alpha-1,2-mannosyltransferase